MRGFIASILLTISAVAFGQLDGRFIMAVSSFSNVVTVDDSTYTADLSFQSDQTGSGYLANQIQAGWRILTSTKRQYVVTVVNSSSFTTANLTFEELPGTTLGPTGTGICYQYDGSTELIPLYPVNSTGITAALAANIQNHNVEKMAAGGGLNELEIRGDSIGIVGGNAVETPQNDLTNVKVEAAEFLPDLFGSFRGFERTNGNRRHYVTINEGGFNPANVYSIGFRSTVDGSYSRLLGRSTGNTYLETFNQGFGTSSRIQLTGNQAQFSGSSNYEGIKYLAAADSSLRSQFDSDSLAVPHSGWIESAISDSMSALPANIAYTPIEGATFGFLPEDSVAFDAGFWSGFIGDPVTVDSLGAITGSYSGGFLGTDSADVTYMIIVDAEAIDSTSRFYFEAGQLQSERGSYVSFTINKGRKKVAYYVRSPDSDLFYFIVSGTTRIYELSVFPISYGYAPSGTYSTSATDTSEQNETNLSAGLYSRSYNSTDDYHTVLSSDRDGLLLQAGIDPDNLIDIGTALFVDKENFNVYSFFGLAALKYRLEFNQDRGIIYHNDSLSIGSLNSITASTERFKYGPTISTDSIDTYIATDPKAIPYVGWIQKEISDSLAAKVYTVVKQTEETREDSLISIDSTMFLTLPAGKYELVIDLQFAASSSRDFEAGLTADQTGNWRLEGGTTASGWESFGQGTGLDGGDPALGETPVFLVMKGTIDLASETTIYLQWGEQDTAAVGFATLFPGSFMKATKI